MSTAIVTERTGTPLPAEFEEIFREHSRLIYRTAYGVTGSIEDAQDILQTIFLRLLERDFPRDFHKNPRAYLYRAAVNQSLDIVRKRDRRIFVGEEECLKIAAPSDAARDDEIHQRLYEAIAELNPEAAQIVILRYLHNYSDAEIARMLGVSRAVIAVRLFRLRSRLKKLIQRSLGEQS
jgi:RNA polymerase sigma-70 factor (ECF subfamily)